MATLSLTPLLGNGDTNNTAIYKGQKQCCQCTDGDSGVKKSHSFKIINMASNVFVMVFYNEEHFRNSTGVILQIYY
jgi:hypothetical protein